jgi:uncharacterized SAM-binding protein YcdF (DUF218 family)
MFVMGSLWIVRHAGQWLDVSGPPLAAEYAFVVPGEENSRPIVAAMLYHWGFVQKIIVPENAPGEAQDMGVLPTTGEVICRVLAHEGVPEHAIVPVGGATTSSWDDLAQLAEFMKKNWQSRVVVVTNSFHTRRCWWILRQLLGQEANRAFFVAAPLERYDDIPWWTRREVASTVVGEYLKLGFYWVRYGSGGWWFLGAGVVILAAVGYWRLRSRTQKI